MAEQDDIEDADDAEVVENEDVDDVGDEDDAGGEQQDDPDAVGDKDEDPAQLEAARKRRAIAQRAEERRSENERIARETASATARETTRETEAARRRAEDERAEREAFANMNEGERNTYLLAKEVKNTKDGQQQLTRLTQSSSDQSRFDRMLNKKPQYEKYADEIERRHQNALSQGQMVPREELLKHYIGEMALKNERAANVRRQKDDGARRVRDARGGSGRAARGDNSSRSSGARSLVSRMEDADPLI